MSDPWQPWLDDLADACTSGDRRRVTAHLDNLWRFSFHEERATRPDCWDRLFALLLDLVGSDDRSLRDAALHYVWVVMGDQYGPPWDRHDAADRGAAVCRRTEQLLPALAKVVDAGELSLPELIDALVHVEGLADLAPQPIVDHFLDERRFLGAGGDPLVRAARLAYRGARAGGPTPEKLHQLLDDEAQIVRAYAARTLGLLYTTADAEPEAPLATMVTELTARELARPGIAGPFLSNWYEFGLADFERRSGRRVEDWCFELLAGRSGPEPETLPCSNGIDFFAHELFGGRAGWIERLLELGHEHLALAAATEVDEPLPDLVAVLRRLAESRDDEVARAATWHLASTHREILPAAVARGFVARRRLTGGAELFAAGEPAGSREPATDHATTSARFAVIYPPAGQLFDDAAADAAEAEVLPPSTRGELVTFGMPGDGDAPGPWRHGRSESRRYQSGALVERRGDPDTRRWERVRIVWPGAVARRIPFAPLDADGRPIHGTGSPGAASATKVCTPT